jgi:ketosteroid isomerase-like protein
MVRAAITDALERHAQAALRRDVPSAVSLFTSDATLMFPNSPDVVGRDSIGALMSRSWPAINPTKVRYATNEVTVLGDRAVSMAHYWVTLAPVQDSGRYIFVWKHHPTDGWQVHRALANSLVAPTGR